MINKFRSSIITLVVIGFVIIAGCSSNDDPSISKEKVPAADFVLENLEGKQVSLADTEGKVRLFYFYFSNCLDVCLPTTHMLSLIQEGLKERGVFGTDTALLSITFDPERDTLERLKVVADSYGADPTGWHFLRGEEKYTRDLAYDYGVGVTDTGDGQFLHSNLFIIVDQNGYEVDYFNANTVDIEEVMDYMESLVE